MPADLFKLVNLDLAFPRMLEVVFEVINDCRQDGADYWCVRLYDDLAAQAKLYNQGRTEPGMIVTNAKPGQSGHNFGIGFDFRRAKVQLRNGGHTSDANTEWRKEYYVCLGFMAQRRGLVWGGSWEHPDRPHLNWPGYVTAEQLRPLHEIWQTSHKDTLGALRECWSTIPARQLERIG